MSGLEIIHFICGMWLLCITILLFFTGKHMFRIIITFQQFGILLFVIFISFFVLHWA